MVIATHPQITPASADRKLGKLLVGATSRIWNRAQIVGADFANRFLDQALADCVGFNPSGDLVGYIAVLLPSPWLSVHTEPAPVVRKRGVLPTLVVDTSLFVAPSTRESRLFPIDVIHTEPSAKVTAWSSRKF